MLRFALVICCISASFASAQTPTTQPAIYQSTTPLFSEDFESGTLNKDLWTQQITGNNTLDVQSEKSAHGKFALHVRCPEPSNKTLAFIMANKIPGALKQHHFGRAYMFITPQLPARHSILVMASTPGFPKNKYEEVASANGKWQLTYVDLTGTKMKEDYHAAGSMPNNKWFCLEWEFNDHPNHSTIWIDGQQILGTDFLSKSTKATTDLVGGFTNYAFGFKLWGAAPAPFDLYFDDIALDTKRIGMIAESPKP
jgi:hypothetical protein